MPISHNPDHLFVIETLRHCKALLEEMPDADYYLARRDIHVGGDFLIDDIERSIASLQPKRKDDGKTNNPI